MSELAKDTVIGAGGGVAVTAIAQTVATSLVPIVMAKTGTVVTGVGTIHLAGGLTAGLQWFSMASLGPVGLGIGALAGVAYYVGSNM